ncbi:hypothetical protein G9272_11995 [Streptomyces asoensis]|uniref:Uncharacterized protein n=1 Tax=Streptomyces asoensis TaxID=249586 RepID=A0A6M4WK21_9ACTN|nr:hypothetical protein [Streptomyces asoensis]QJT00940.1 hypothetical protein G9272_11995 [Streptomyces asoensis]
MKLIWLLLGLLLAGLAIGGVVSATNVADTVSVVGDLFIATLLGGAAIAALKRAR